MKLFDRYVLRTFLRVLLGCLVTLTGMYIVIDAFGNLDDFIAYGKNGSVLAIIWDYYSAHSLNFIDSISGILSLIAAMFTVTILQRYHELTALMAAGVPTSRIVAPLLAATIAVSLLSTLNREVLIPSKREKLANNAQNWNGDKARHLTPRYDHKSNIHIDGSHTFADEQRIEAPNFRLPTSLHGLGRRLTAEQGYYHPPRDDRPGGYLLDMVQPVKVTQQDDVYLQGELLILTPKRHSWLEEQQCFVISNVGFEHLASADSWRRHSSAFELIRGLHNSSLDFGADVRVTIHSRFVRPLLDIILLFLGLPLVLTRKSGDKFVAIGKCLALVVTFRLVVLGCEYMGGAYLLSPALAAWTPLIIFGPIAVFTAHSLWE